MVRFGSVCSGIEAASVAWSPLGWECEFVAENAPFPSAVLKHRFPEVPNLGDFTTIRDTPTGRRIDLLVGGTPCQSFSIAGLRGGLGDDRGNLALEYFRLADRLKPRWLVWENVPGVLSANGGRDFGSILGALVELGYGFAYRVLDAQHFGIPQRRRRVFLVGYLGDWRRAAAVLFERSGVFRDLAPRRKKGNEIAGTLGGGSGGRGWCNDLERSGAFIPLRDGVYGRNVAHTTTTHQAKGGDPTTDNYVVESHLKDDITDEEFTAEIERFRRISGLPQVQSVAQNQRGEVVLSDVTQALSSGGGKPGQGYPCIAFHASQDPISSSSFVPALSSSASFGVACITGQVTHTLRAEGFDASEDGTGRGQPMVNVGAYKVRRLTPRECERLQGFDDDWTLVPWKKGTAPDGPRYAAVGNSMAVPVMVRIGERIQLVEDLTS